MNRPAVFVAELVDIKLDFGNRAATIHARIDVHDLGCFFTHVGVPPAQENCHAFEECPPLLLMPCRRPRHPERDEDVQAEAAISTLEQLFRSRALTLTPALVNRFTSLLQILREVSNGGETTR